jgi:ABC-2 type transport system ATP-binding protein
MTESKPILQLVGLTMKFDKTLALDNLSLSIQRGDIYGLIGPNGAGKTTTFKIVATILRPTKGHIVIAGMDARMSHHIRDIRRKIGYMPDSFGVYEDMTVEEYLSFFAAAYDITNPKRQQLVNDVLELVDLNVKKDALIETLSRGMQQRLGIARVLIHDPELLILDEPASGLDPRARIEIRSLLLELKKMGKTILISSHILADLGEICTRVGIIEKGKLLVDGTLQDVLRMVKPSSVISLRVAEDPGRALEALTKLPFVVSAQLQNETVVLEVEPGFRDVWKISAALTDKGFKLNYIQQESESLERAFIELTEGTVS